jgi:uncharacterized membrane-anchored protein
MKTKHLITAFALTAIAQLFIPAKMVYDNHITETRGTVYKFKARPVDPADPFRGRYITLRFEADTFAITNFKEQRGQELYALLGKDSLGFARIKGVQYERPAQGDYIVAAEYYQYSSTLHLELPFDRYYMEESKAPVAESAYNQHVRSNAGALPAYGEVAVKDGNAVLKRVIINGMPVEEYVQHKVANK